MEVNCVVVLETGNKKQEIENGKKKMLALTVAAEEEKKTAVLYCVPNMEA